MPVNLTITDPRYERMKAWRLFGFTLLARIRYEDSPDQEESL